MLSLPCPLTPLKLWDVENSTVPPWQVMGRKHTGTSQKMSCKDRSAGTLPVCEHVQLDVKAHHEAEQCALIGPENCAVDTELGLCSWRVGSNVFPLCSSLPTALPDQIFLTLEDKTAIKESYFWVLFSPCSTGISPILNLVGAVSCINFIFLLCWGKPER